MLKCSNGMEYLHLENKTNEPSGKNAEGHHPTTRFYVPKTKVKTEQPMTTCHECGACLSRDISDVMGRGMARQREAI